MHSRSRAPSRRATVWALPDGSRCPFARRASRSIFCRTGSRRATGSWRRGGSSPSSTRRRTPGSAPSEPQLDRRGELVRLEAERAFTTLERDAPVAPDQIEPVGPAAVPARDLVVESVEKHGNAHLEPERTRL